MAAAPRTVLVVDDEPLVVAVLAQALGDAGWVVRHAPDGRAALAAVDEDLPDVVLADVQMPWLDGAALARVLRHRDPPVPVVLMSAARAAYADVTEDLPGVVLLAKPFSIEEVVTAIAQAVGTP